MNAKTPGEPPDSVGTKPTSTYTFPSPKALASSEEQERILRNCYRMIRQWAAEARAEEERTKKIPESLAN